MTCALNQMERRIRPCLMQSVSIFDRTGHVVATVHDCSRNAAKAMRIPKKLPLLQPALMNEIVVFQPRKCEREVVVTMGCRECLVRQERDRFTFPQRPCLGCLDLRSLVFTSKQLPIG